MRAVDWRSLAAAAALCLAGLAPGHAEPVPAPEIRLDYSRAPQMRSFAWAARARCEAWYARFAATLRSEGYKPPREFTFVFVPGGDDPAGTSGTEVTCSAAYFESHPDDAGALIHEMVHVIQSYPKYDPVWLVEGVADYLRWFVYEPAARRPHVDPERSRYTRGYQDCGAFLAWIVARRGQGFITSLNAALREDRYTPAFWTNATGKSLDALWDEYVADSRAPHPPATPKKNREKK